MNRTRWNNLILINGLLCIVLAITVMAGWQTENQILVQIHKSFAPMQFNTALAFLFSGLALICVYKGRRDCSQVAGVIVAFIGFSSLLQYVFHIDLHIDHIFTDHTITTKTSHPGRMAPNTAICFTLTGLAFILRPFNRHVFIGFAVVVLLFSFLSLIGYIFHTENLYGWGNLTRMAIHTAIGFSLVGTGMLAGAYVNAPNSRFDMWSMTPFTLATLVFVMTFFFWHNMEEAREARINMQFKTLTEETNDALLERYTLYEQSLRSGLALFYASQSVERGEWHDFVKALRVDENLPGINGIGYIDYVTEENLDSYLQQTRADDAPEFKNHPETDFDDKFIINYIEPVFRNKEAVGLDIGFEANRRAAAERARDTGQASLTKKIQLVQDNKKQPGFLLLIPVYEGKNTPQNEQERREQILGWVYAPFMGSNFMTDLTNVSNERLSFAVFDGKGTDEKNIIYSSPKYTETADYMLQSTLSIAGQTWTIAWASTSKMVASIDDNAPTLLAIFGLLFSILVYFAFSRIMHSRETIAKEVEKQTREVRKNRKILEQTNQELIRSNKELERFAYIASHDLQEPLRKIGGFTDRLNQKIGDDLDEQTQVYMNFILDGVERMRNLIQGLLAYSRITTEDVKVEKLDANEIVALAVDNLSERVKDTKATVQFQDLPVVSYDKIMLTQLFQNLIGNAMKYKSDRDPMIEISATDKGEVWEFAVKDNGMGMEEKYFDRIFTMFQRLHRKEDIPGTGIGLSLCQKIVERYGGRIYLTSTPDIGSTFYFTVVK